MDDALAATPSAVTATNRDTAPRRYKRALLFALVVIVLLAAGIWFARWWTHGRFVESTDDAYLRADFVTISPKIPGYIDRVLVKDNQPVRRGQALVVLEAVDYRAAAAQAAAQQGLAGASIAESDASAAEQEAAIAEAGAKLESARRSLAQTNRDAARYAPLARSGAEPTERYEAILLQHDKATSDVAIARASLAGARARIAVLRARRAQGSAQRASADALSSRANADLAAIVIRSSIDGVVGNRTARVGQFVQPAARLMSIVPIQELYLVANFKETQTGAMRIGQPAEISVDALPDVTVRGRVESFAPATGALFSLLPPENATGNFTKIVQRVPVRIVIDADSAVRAVLRPGLSVHVSVDTAAPAKRRP